METPSLPDIIAGTVTALASIGLTVGIRLAQKNEKNGIAGRMRALEAKLEKAEEQKRILMLGMDTILELSSRLVPQHDQRWLARLEDTRRRVREELEG